MRSSNGNWPPNSALAESEIWQRLGRWREAPLTLEELERVLEGGASLPPALAEALAERLALRGDEALHPLLGLIQRQGARDHLVAALGMIHRPEVRDRLLGWIGDPAVNQAVVLRALAPWGRRVDLSVIASALQAAACELRLAGLQLLAFRVRDLAASELLRLCKEPLADLRAEVVVAALRVLQRRDEPVIVEAIAAQVREDLPSPVATTALQALGCIGTLESATALVLLEERVASPGLRRQLERQLSGLIRHRDAMVTLVRERQCCGAMDPERARSLAGLLA